MHGSELTKHMSEPMEEKDAAAIVWQLLLAVNYLH